MTSFEDLLVTHRSALLRECWKYYRQKFDVWDLFQQSCVKMLNGFHTFDQECDFLPWARRVILTTHQDQKRAKEREFSGINVLNFENMDELNSESPQIGEQVSYLLQFLTEEEAELIVNYYVNENSQTTLAKLYGISQPAVRKRIQVVTEKFKKLYREHFYDRKDN